MTRSALCDNCGSTDIKIVYTSPADPQHAAKTPLRYTISDPRPAKPLAIGRCETCGLVFVLRNSGNPVTLEDYENCIDEEYIKEEKGRRRSARIILRRIGSFVKTGRMLEIGCANGFFIDEARKAGWEVAGAEPSRWARQYAAERLGVRTIYPTIKEAGFARESFDVIVMLDVIEHLESPREMMRVIEKILKKDGVLVISTPDVESFLSILLGAKWWGINKHHLFYFSKKTLEYLLGQTGFEVLCYKSHVRIFTVGYWVKRVSSYSKLLQVIAKPFLRVHRFDKQNVKINLYDQIETYIKKVQNDI